MPHSTEEILKHDTTTNKNTFKLIFFAYGYGISQNVFMKYLYMLIVNTPSKVKKATHQILWIILNIDIDQQMALFDMHDQSFLFLNNFQKN